MSEPSTLDLNMTYRAPGFTLSVAQSIPAIGTTAIFGPSGSGKTTLLSLIAGFLKPSEGRIVFNEDVWVDTTQRQYTAPHQRSTGFLFQDSRLFDHLTVRGNLDYAERRARDKTGRSYSYEDVISATDVGELLDRQCGTLSGGEQKRVALCRTLLSRPKLLLFDEPLSGLDTARKIEILPFIYKLPRQFNIPCLYVSHDVNEVSRLADHVMVLDGGNVKAFGKTARILSSYDLDIGRNPYERGSHLHVRVKEFDLVSELMGLTSGQSTLWLPLQADAKLGDSLKLNIYARDVALALAPPEALSIQNVLTATVTSIANDEESAFCDVHLDTDGQDITARITRRAARQLQLEPGKAVYALIKAANFQR